MDETVESYRDRIRDESLGDLVDRLIQCRIEDYLDDEDDDDVTSASRRTLKMRAIRREIDDRFLSHMQKGDEIESSNEPESTPQSISSLVDY